LAIDFSIGCVDQLPIIDGFLSRDLKNNINIWLIKAQFFSQSAVQYSRYMQTALPI